MSKQQKIPLFLKGVYLLFMAFYIPIFWIGYGPQNFLWISSVVLILAFLAVMFESRFLASMAAVGGLIPESLWVLDFLFTSISLLIGGSVTGFTIYMFHRDLSIFLKVLAGFHIVLPPLFIWLIVRLGYDSRAWLVQVVFTWILFLVAWFFTSPTLNINFVFSYEKFSFVKMGALHFLMILFTSAIVVGAITHLILKTIQKKGS